MTNETKAVDTLLENVKEWSESGSRTFIAVMADIDSGEVRAMFKGDALMIGSIILKLMEQEPEVAKNIYTAAAIYGLNHFTPEYIQVVNETAAAYIAKCSEEEETKTKTM